MFKKRAEKDVIPAYTRLRYWFRYYGNMYSDDKRAVEDFVEVETDEIVRALKQELIAVSNGRFKEKSFDQLVRPKRKVRHKSYRRWGEIMLIWLNEARRR